MTFIAAPGDDYFEQHVRPLLVAHCYSCHSAGAKSVRGGLLLDTKPGWQTGGDTGPAIIPGDPDKSLLVEAVRYHGELKMPPKGKLPDADVEKLVAWVKMGAPDSRTGAAKLAKGVDLEKGREHWAFQPLTNSTPPAIAGRSPVDEFLQKKRDAAGVAANPSADPRTQLRRLAFDLTGLPPSPDDIDAFTADPSDAAYRLFVKQYLSSPHFGERYARHWLDVARFAESHGYEQDYDRPNAYHYRDFVTRAFNDDLPYTTFVRWQLAGDEYAPDNLEAMKATGYLAAGTHATQITANQAEKERYDELDDIVRTTGTTMLGLTIGCARCHDHKFDPLPTRDYSRLTAVFSTTVRSDREFVTDADPPRPSPDFIGPVPQTKVKILVCSENVPAVRLHTQGQDFYDPVHFLRRGDVNQKIEPATPGYVQVLTRSAESRWQQPPPAGATTSHRRRALAEWMTDVECGAGHLLARVIVNRLWYWHFGRGIVATPSDFGTQGEPPAHPELLDWLAGELIRHGWRLKPIHELIVTSDAYRQSGAKDETRLKKDRANALVWHRPARRLEAEAIRDAMLAVSGRLEPVLYGPGTLDPNHRRRSLYFFVKRSRLVPMMSLFDGPDTLQDLAQRSTTTVAPQALHLLNDGFVRECGRALAARAAAGDTASSLRRAFRLALGRLPTGAEERALTGFVAAQAADYAGRDGAEQLALADACHAILCLNEFVMIE